MTPLAPPVSIVRTRLSDFVVTHGWRVAAERLGLPATTLRAVTTGDRDPSAALVREDGTHVSPAPHYASMSEALLALAFDYADELHYRVTPVADEGAET